MKTIVQKETNISLYVVQDDDLVVVNKFTIEIGNPADTIVCDCGADSVLVYANVTPPDDWKGCKYLFSNGIWSPNPGWTDPNNPPSIPQES